MKPSSFNATQVLDKLDDSLADFRTISSALQEVQDDGALEPIRICLYNCIRRFQAVRDEMLAAVQPGGVA